MSDRPSRHGTNDRRVLGEGKNGLRVNPPSSFTPGGHPDIRGAVCVRCGVELHGHGIDHADGWLCAIDCSRWQR